MPIKFPCPHCSHKLKAKDEQAERTLPCPNPACQKPITVPKTATEWVKDMLKSIDLGAGVNEANYHSNAIVDKVLATGREDIWEFCVNECVDEDIIKQKRMWMLGAAYGGYLDAMEWLKKNNIRVDEPVSEDKLKSNLPIHLAAYRGHVSAVKWLLDQDRKLVHAKGVEGRTPLHLAAATGKVEVMRLLRSLITDENEWKAVINAQDDETGATPLHVAVGQGNTASIECLVKELGADVNAKNNRNVTPLLAAAHGHQVDGMDCLYDLCKDLKKELKMEEGGITIWIIADSPGWADIKNWLNRKGLVKPVSKPKPSKITNIFEAAEIGTVDDVKYFVEQKGVDVNITNDKGSIPLHRAVDNPDINVMKYLVSKGANVNAKNNDGNTPLYSAAWDNPNVKFLQYLISEGADVDARNNKGNTPLYIAAQYNSKVEVLEYLISQNADVNAVCFQGNTPLHIAAQCNTNVDILKCLIDHEADVNSNPHNDGLTPVVLAAARNSNVEILKYLISQGADISDGFTLRKFATDMNSNPEVLRYITSVTS